MENVANPMESNLSSQVNGCPAVNDVVYTPSEGTHLLFRIIIVTLIAIRPFRYCYNICFIGLYLRDNFNKILNHFTPNGHSMGRTAQLTSSCCILYIYSTNIRTEYFKHAA